MITLKNGAQKFIPGVNDKNGRFIPGQIIETVRCALKNLKIIFEQKFFQNLKKMGPTFIPG